MKAIPKLIQELRARADVEIVDDVQAWQIVINKGRDLICAVTVPHSVLEWYASVTNSVEKKEVWSDWMDYSGYDDRPKEELEADMAKDIRAFVRRVIRLDKLFPLQIYERDADNAKE